MAQFDCLEKPLSGFFFRHGRLVARHPLPFILFPALLTAGLALGFLHTDEITDATYLFTPADAPSKYERQVIHDKWPVRSDNYIPGRAVTQAREIQVIAHARENGNILLEEYSEAVDRLNLYIMNKVAIRYKGKEYFYNDLCLGWREEGCFRNAQVVLLSRIWSGGTNVTYPSFRFGVYNIFLGSSLGGAELWRGSDDRDYLVGAKAWFLVYQLKFQNDTLNFLSGLWEREVEEVLLRYKDPYIQLTFFHSQTLTEELKRNAEELVPKFVISFTILIIFSITCSFTFLPGRFPMVDWVTSKPLLALCGVISAGMAVGSAIGLLNFLGMPFNSIVLVMPFLAVSIGIDNMFLMIASVRRTPRAHKVEDRIGDSLAESAISITITAMTDALSFGVGAITSIPAVQIFCVYTCVAIVMTFLYQLTFFLALMVLQMRAEEKGRHCVLGTKTRSPTNSRKVSLMGKLFWLGTQPPTPVAAGAAGKKKEQDPDDIMTVFFRDWFAPILMHPVMKVLIMTWLLIYLAFGIWGCTLLREGLEPINLLVRDSYAIPHYKNLESYFWSYGTQVQIVVNTSPDMSSSLEREKVRTMIKAFTNTDHTLNYDSTQFWLDEFERWAIKDLSYRPNDFEGHRKFYDLLCVFLDTNTHNRYLDVGVRGIGSGD